MDGTGITRWAQLALGIICMIMISNLQYGWTLFVLPMDKAHHWGKPAIQLAFTIFVLCETWLLPFTGYFIDKLGPRVAVILGGLLIGESWVLNSQADTLTTLYISNGLGGLGAGMIYGAVIGNAIRWFPDKRGLAAGLSAAGFGAGSAFTVVPIANMIATQGYQTTFIVFGLVQGFVVMAAAMLLQAPRERNYIRTEGLGEGGMMAMRASSLHYITKEYGPLEVARTPVFWVMYAMFVLVSAGGLIATAQLAVIAFDFGVSSSPVTIAFITMPALIFALSLDRVMNGVTRPFFGWLSDLIGRENTMFIAFILEGAGILLLIPCSHSPLLFVIMTGFVFFAWGEIYSLFPTTSGDTFGRKFAASNYGMLYTAKGTAALLIPLGSILRDATGDWLAVIYVAAVANLIAAGLAVFALKPMRQNFLEKSIAARAAERRAEDKARASAQIAPPAWSGL